MHIISHQNEPLLFVHGPPVYISVSVTDEESTSVFVQNGDAVAETIDTELKEVQPALYVKPSILRRIKELQKPFQRQVYKPLKFIIGDEAISGEIEKIEGETVFVNVAGDEDVIKAVEMNTIEEILWRGMPFQEL